jgi:hypothetical protein
MRQRLDMTKSVIATESMVFLFTLRTTNVLLLWTGGVGLLMLAACRRMVIIVAKLSPYLSSRQHRQILFLPAFRFSPHVDRQACLQFALPSADITGLHWIQSSTNSVVQQLPPLAFGRIKQAGGLCVFRGEEIFRISIRCMLFSFISNHHSSS